MGASGEKTCWQYMPATWRAESQRIIGYVAPLTEENAEYVATIKVQQLLDRGRSEHSIILAWNAGENAKNCSKGVNKYGVAYNSCAYVAKYKSHSSQVAVN